MTCWLPRRSRTSQTCPAGRPLLLVLPWPTSTMSGCRGRRGLAGGLGCGRRGCSRAGVGRSSYGPRAGGSRGGRSGRRLGFRSGTKRSGWSCRAAWCGRGGALLGPVAAAGHGHVEGGVDEPVEDRLGYLTTAWRVSEASVTGPRVCEPCCRRRLISRVHDEHVSGAACADVLGRGVRDGGA